MKEENEYCKCSVVKGVYAELVDVGYWDCCSDCEKRLEDGFHYHDEPEGIY
jgi:hypothetical protein